MFVRWASGAMAMIAVATTLGGEPRFQTRFRAFATDPGPYDAAIGDFNEDGRPDLVSVNGASVSLLFGRGDGTFEPPRIFETHVQSQDVVSGDFDEDGHLDLAMPNEFAGSVLVLLGDGAGDFLGFNDFATLPFPVALATTDFNLDGNLD